MPQTKDNGFKDLVKRRDELAQLLQNTDFVLPEDTRTDLQLELHKMNSDLVENYSFAIRPRRAKGTTL